MSRTLAFALVLAAFTAFSFYALEVHGYVGFFEAMLSSTAGVVAFVDLVIALSLATFWMWSDAHERALPFWPYALVTLALGSAGLLSYLIHRELRARAPARVTA
jgi:hypothetical protein